MVLPRLAVFPKAFMDELCVHGSMDLETWIRMAATLDIEGLEFYAGFADLADASRWSHYRRVFRKRGAGDTNAVLFPRLYLAGCWQKEATD